jgi:tetratricopeptide (TPR) repeat protein
MKHATLILMSLCVQSTLSQPNPGAGQTALRQQGDAAITSGDFDSAISDYQKAFELDGSKDIELLKRIATLHSWKRDYSGARELLRTILEQYPSDEEAASSLEALDIRRGLQLSGSYGEGEIDYTRKVFSLHGFYGGVDWLDLHAGYSRSDKPFYNRSEFSVDAYCFSFLPHLRSAGDETQELHLSILI